MTKKKHKKQRISQAVVTASARGKAPIILIGSLIAACVVGLVAAISVILYQRNLAQEACNEYFRAANDSELQMVVFRKFPKTSIGCWSALKAVKQRIETGLQLQEAREVCAEIGKHAPNDYLKDLALYLLAFSYEKEEQYDQALEAYQTAEGTVTDSIIVAQVGLAKARVLAFQKQWEEALGVLDSLMGKLSADHAFREVIKETRDFYFSQKLHSDVE